MYLDVHNSHGMALQLGNGPSNIRIPDAHQVISAACHQEVEILVIVKAVYALSSETGQSLVTSGMVSIMVHKRNCHMKIMIFYEGCFISNLVEFEHIGFLLPLNVHDD